MSTGSSRHEDTSQELSLLQTLRLKGRATSDALASAAGIDNATVERLVDSAVDAERCTRTGQFVKLSASGKERLAELTAAERASVDHAGLEGLYEEFDFYNNDLKTLVTDWQMKDGNTPNDHADAAYDEEIVRRLSELHESFLPWLGKLAALNKRLAHYTARFDYALDKVRGGDHSFIARPIADSYHTVWFELHEELIGLLGRDRASEAAAGRAV
ncbi:MULTISPECIES: hypothetical protein [unclassified Rhodococcus (in: high G+C Gram-positive bacteria)]|uniref:hypothetical protein n=1 Tax=unclassified Rhodococcus (in: high G+C Gram-positive bacteria) TaxID=192944 RepID=UPI00163B5149|nr:MULTISPECIES: hypothetical protein [unclassified Rhodococcus (in: high G+C Gram-positive bacteria)]MBC2640242.1 hypothetical protein [Rhodococcus sp. 3A]MBC2895012.1 hypothetical protein [Rhodococcus sp. 4CII]